MKKMCGFALDGASSNTSEVKGLNYFFKKENPKNIFVWCLVHRLNLAISNGSKNSTIITNIINMLHETSVFFKQSPKRMDIWRSTAKSHMKT